jgi:hypothetical protein
LIIIVSSSLEQIGGLQSSELTTLIYILSFVVLTLVSFVFATRIQAYMMLSEIGRNLTKFETFKDNSRRDVLHYLISNCGVSQADAEREVTRIIEYFTIMPEGMDPAGVVGKMEQESDCKMTE